MDGGGYCKTMPITKLPKAVLFDWDNTLVDTLKGIYEVFHPLYTEYTGKPISRETHEKVARCSGRQLFPQIFEDEWEVYRDRFLKEYDAKHIDYLDPMPYALDLVTFFKEREIPMAIVTNKMGHHLKKEIEVVGWQKFFVTTVSSQEAEHDKPHPAPLLKALSGMNMLASQDVWMVGDSIADWESSKAAGCTSIAVHNKSEDSGPHYFETLESFYRTIATSNNKKPERLKHQL